MAPYSHIDYGGRTRRRRLVPFQRTATLVLVLLFCCLATRRLGILPIGCTSGRLKGAQITFRTYSTKFELTENPISEGGNWSNGKAVGLDWADIKTTPGLAYGTESGQGGFDDSTALLTGTWLPNQMAEATVHSVNQNDNIYEEVELRLRSSLSPHRSTGYEISFRCSKTANAYAQIVRWDGPLGKFTYLNSQWGPQYRVADGDVVKAMIIGNMIAAYINGVQVLHASDNTYATGNPGMGLFLGGAGSVNSNYEFASGVNSDYAFTSFTASDELSFWDAVSQISVGAYKEMLQQSKRLVKSVIRQLRERSVALCQR